MDIHDSEITEIIKNKYPLEITNSAEININIERFFSDSVGNYVVLEAEEDATVTITFFFGDILSHDDAFKQRNGGVFFITQSITEFRMLFSMNLVYEDNSLN